MVSPDIQRTTGPSVLLGHFFMTGISSGIGHVVLQRALADGHIVTGIVRNDAQKSELLHNHPERLNLFVGDLRDAERISAIAERVRRIDFSHVLLNAGYAEMGKLPDVSEQSIQQMFQANLIAHVILARSLVASCLTNNAKLCIVSSLTARVPGSNYAAYGMAKAGLSYLADALAFEYPKLRTLCIEIGGVQTPFHTKAQTVFSSRRLKPQDDAGNRLYDAVLHKSGVTTLYWQWAVWRSLLVHFHDIVISLGRKWHGHHDGR
jgi:uncharacterized protein